MSQQKKIELNDLTSDERRALAEKVHKSPVFLWQCGAGIRVPSLETADHLITHEPRLTVKTLLAPKRRRNTL